MKYKDLFKGAITFSSPSRKNEKGAGSLLLRVPGTRFGGPPPFPKNMGPAEAQFFRGWGCPFLKGGRTQLSRDHLPRGGRLFYREPASTRFEGCRFWFILGSRGPVFGEGFGPFWDPWRLFWSCWMPLWSIFGTRWASGASAVPEVWI